MDNPFLVQCPECNTTNNTTRCRCYKCNAPILLSPDPVPQNPVRINTHYEMGVDVGLRNSDKTFLMLCFTGDEGHLYTIKNYQLIELTPNMKFIATNREMLDDLVKAGVKPSQVVLQNELTEGE